MWLLFRLCTLPRALVAAAGVPEQDFLLLSAVQLHSDMLTLTHLRHTCASTLVRAHCAYFLLGPWIPSHFAPCVIWVLGVPSNSASCMWSPYGGVCALGFLSYEQIST